MTSSVPILFPIPAGSTISDTGMHLSATVKKYINMLSCVLPMKHEVPQCQAVGDTPLATSHSLAGPSFYRAGCTGLIWPVCCYETSPCISF